MDEFDIIFPAKLYDYLKLAKKELERALQAVYTR